MSEDNVKQLMIYYDNYIKIAKKVLFRDKKI